MSVLLEISGMRVQYGVVEAVKRIDLVLRRGEVTALLGSNGAGKSTTLLALSGLVKLTQGSIRLNGVELGSLSPHQIVACGVVQVPEGREILTTLTVKENLLLGAHRRRDRRKIGADLDAMLVSFPRLRDRLHTAAGYLSGGEQQMLAIARALMAKPSLLLLDEPSMGLAPIVVTEIFGIVRALNEQGLTIFLVEQNARQALGIAHHGYVMENGQIVLSGTGKELLVNPKIVEAYLGR
ncbi:MAG TPA: ABC transporter ATP-binding protein [Candidatus Eisenbacteria bacterium]|nr:ABC transporter ATP-binding protein [Candidatus Eisenbacteria bacterium]